LVLKRKHLLPLFLLFQIIFLRFLAFFPETVERFYSNGLYVYISRFFRIVLGKIPFSVGDIIYGIVIIYGVYWFYKNRKLSWKSKGWSALSFLSVFYFLFHLLWAFNYYREPLFEKMNIQRDYTKEDLYAFTEKLIIKTNEVQFQITHNKNQKVINPYSQDSIFIMTQNGYDNLAKQYPYFKYEIPSRKKSLFSLPLTYMGFGGYLNPFTNESQVNDKLPMYGFPNVVCHEMAHQIGFASESECNFIGFMACIKNKDLYFQYAAYTLALRYCLENVFFKDEAKFKALKPTINRGIFENYKESELFWEQYDTFIDKGFHIFYDQFLKTNQQQDGIESYSKFVNLLINYYKVKDSKQEDFL
jgi:predicted membrane protein